MVVPTGPLLAVLTFAGLMTFDSACVSPGPTAPPVEQWYHAGEVEGFQIHTPTPGAQVRLLDLGDGTFMSFETTDVPVYEGPTDWPTKVDLMGQNPGL